jgi:hypothetical protein
VPLRDRGHRGDRRRGRDHAPADRRRFRDDGDRPALGVPKITVVGTALPDGPSWWWLFGMSGTTPLEVTVRNDGTAAAVDPPVTLAAGPEGGPGQVVPPPELGAIQPGEQRTFRVEVGLDGPVFGAYEVSGTIQGTVLRARDSVYPIALLALLVVPLHLTTAWIVFTAPLPAVPDRAARKRDAVRA